MAAILANEPSCLRAELGEYVQTHLCGLIRLLCFCFGVGVGFGVGFGLDLVCFGGLRLVSCFGFGFVSVLFRFSVWFSLI